MIAGRDSGKVLTENVPNVSTSSIEAAFSHHDSWDEGRDDGKVLTGNVKKSNEALSAHSGSKKRKIDDTPVTK